MVKPVKVFIVVNALVLCMQTINMASFYLETFTQDSCDGVQFSLFLGIVFCIVVLCTRGTGRINYGLKILYLFILIINMVLVFDEIHRVFWVTYRGLNISVLENGMKDSKLNMHETRVFERMIPVVVVVIEFCSISNCIKKITRKG